MTPYTLSDFELRRLKADLKSAVKTGHSATVERELLRAHAVFARQGWPDCHGDWQRAVDDAQFQAAVANCW
jgi:hypothetical protein